MAITIVRAFNADGYRKDILVVDERQVWSADERCKDKLILDGVIGHGRVIDPKDFPEVVEFQIVVEGK